MDEIEAGTESERIDTGRTLFLGICTTALAIAFIALLIGDNATAITF